MSQRIVAILVSAVLGLTIVESRAADPAKMSLNDLSMEVEALLALQRFDFTAAQLQAVRKWAPETSQKPSKREEPKENAKLRQALIELREELVKMEPDDDKVADLEERLTDLKDAEDTDLDDDVEITDGARKRTPELLRLLSPRQVTAYLNERAEDIPDPLDVLTEAMDQASELNDAEWKELFDEIVEELSWVLGGLDKKRAKAAGDSVERWLFQVRAAAKLRALTKQRPELEKAARLLMLQVPPTIVLHNFVEHSMAELLSNPRLAAALDSRSSK
jgi:small-conductance mechanosensitive channel